ncbi:class I SAM-dependent methyltransferase [Streptomyces avermitilis]
MQQPLGAARLGGDGPARAEREGIANASFTRGDVQVYPFEAGAFDVAISRYGVMFFADPLAAFVNVGRALRPGGRLAFVCPADATLNGWVAAVASLRDFLPLGDFGRPGQPLAAPDRIRHVLTVAGFTGITINQAQTYGAWGHGAEDAAEFLLGTGPGRHLMEQADATARARARRTLTGLLRDHEAADGTVRLRSTSWLVTADRPADPSDTPQGRPPATGSSAEQAEIYLAHYAAVHGPSRGVGSRPPGPPQVAPAACWTVMP